MTRFAFLFVASFCLGVLCSMAVYGLLVWWDRRRRTDGSAHIPRQPNLRLIGYVEESQKAYAKRMPK